MTSGVAVMVRLRRNVIGKFYGRTLREFIFNGMDCEMPFSLTEENNNFQYAGSNLVKWQRGGRQGHFLQMNC
jgi:hypothetical protein